MLFEESRSKRCIWRSGKGTEERLPEAIGICVKDVPEFLSEREPGNLTVTWNSEGSRMPFHGTEAATEFKSDGGNLDTYIGPSAMP